jgi:ABC-type arginine transport system permease subunit
MMKQIFTGQLTSYASSQNVVEQIWKGLPATLSLCIGAAVLWMVLAIWFGYLSAVHAGKFTDRALTILSLVGISVPVFWLAAILLYYLSFKAELFPTSGYVPLSRDPLDWAYHLILPWLTLAVLYVGFYSRVLRSNMLDVMNDDHVRTARAKGISERQVRIKHVLRNSMIPVVTLFGLDFGAVVGGYHSDMTRTFVLHRAADWQRDIYDLVATAQAAGRTALAPGMELRDVDAAARAVIDDAGHGDHYVHGLGHGVGLEIHEAPGIGKLSTGTLPCGAAVTVEPGVYLPGWGGVRIEDTLVVTQGDPELLTTTDKTFTVI